ncbi:MAG: aspartate aminotransferase, partial [Chthoniobacteraceae bacterium]
CHLATEWTARFGLPPELSSRALISCGVRDSLALLFRHYAREGARLWLPADTYPVYGELARAAGLVPLEFLTLPEPAWPTSPPLPVAELLVVTNPLKPLGRWLSPGDVAALTAWLGMSPRRRLLLDAVYTFETRFHPTTLQLLATQQTILLHSLTKGWLDPRLFGVALVAECDAAALTPAFRTQPPPQSNLARARELMAQHCGMPVTISRELDAARSRLLASISQHLTSLATADAPGYFTPVAGRWQDILDGSKALGLPATVFGSQREDITILSSLSFLP